MLRNLSSFYLINDLSNSFQDKKKRIPIKQYKKQLEKTFSAQAVLMEKDKKEKDKKNSILSYEINLGGVSLTQKAFFAKNLSIMLTAGLTITDALEISVDSATGKLKSILREVASSIESGRSFSESLSAYPKVFPTFFTSAIYAGEQSGSLEENLTQIAIQLTKEKELASKIKGAMIYPVIILIASLVLGLFVSFFVLPKITPLFAGMGSNLPIATRILMNFSDFIEKSGGIFFVSLMTFLIIGAWLTKQKFSHPYTHWIFLHFPLIKGIARGSNLARFSRTLGALLKSGLNIDEALMITRQSVGNYYYQVVLDKITTRINTGATMSVALADYEKLFPRIAIKMIKVGEESGHLDETLIYLADFYEEEVDNATKSLSTAIEPILLLVIGSAVGFLALAIITPIYNITGSMRGA